MKLPSVINKHKFLIGGVVLAGIGLVAYSKLKHSQYLAPSAPPMMPASTNTVFAGVGRVNAANPGLADDSDSDNQNHWVAAGHAAGLDPNPYSNLTRKNEEVLYSHLPHEVFSGAPAKNFEAMKFQGSWGLTGPPGQGFFTYF
jgi:hypothetical protein